MEHNQATEQKDLSKHHEDQQYFIHLDCFVVLVLIQYESKLRPHAVEIK